MTPVLIEPLARLAAILPLSAVIGPDVLTAPRAARPLKVAVEPVTGPAEDMEPAVRRFVIDAADAVSGPLLLTLNEVKAPERDRAPADTNATNEPVLAVSDPAELTELPVRLPEALT